mgnify:CR=1 FL=1|tara:strand:- start:2788 stop:3555 length:768 start_codon:yes stop_codon:yes gene_type:complete
MQKPNANRRRENLFLSLVFNLIIPILLLQEWFGLWVANQLSMDSKDERLAVAILIFALAFPLGYGIHDFVVRRRCNLVSLLGFVNVLLTGGIGLLQLPAHLFAIKEAAFPAFIACLLIAFRNSKNSLTQTFLYNPEVIRTDLIEIALNERGNKQKFDVLLSGSSLWLAGSFLISSALNYALARYFVTTNPWVDLSEYNDQVSKMMGWSYLVIALPCMIITGVVLWRLFAGIRELTGLEPEEVMVAKPKKGKEPTD